MGIDWAYSGTGEGQAECKPAVYPLSPESPGLHPGQQVEGDDPAPLRCAVRPHLKYWVQMWSPEHTRYIDMLKCVQRRAKK